MTESAHARFRPTAREDGERLQQGFGSNVSGGGSPLSGK
jgi:hypothetical protein